MRQFHFDFCWFFWFFGSVFFLNGFSNPFIVRSRSSFLFSQWKFFELYVRTCPAMFFLIRDLFAHLIKNNVFCSIWLLLQQIISRIHTHQRAQAMRKHAWFFPFMPPSPILRMILTMILIFYNCIFWQGFIKYWHVLCKWKVNNVLGDIFVSPLIWLWYRVSVFLKRIVVTKNLSAGAN